MPPRSKEKVKTFEQSMARLEEISARLDNPETGLEETIALVEEGRRLVAASRALLEQAELRINKIDVAAQPATAVTPNDDDHEFSLI